MRRFNELGLLLPVLGDLDTDDVAAIAEARLVIAEINKTRSEMDALLELERRGQDVISLSDNNSPGRPPRMKRPQFLGDAGAARTRAFRRRRRDRCRIAGTETI